MLIVSLWYDLRIAAETIGGLLERHAEHGPPFADGNKRTARMLGNAVLLARGYAALSYRSADEVAYKQSVLLVDEQHSLYWYKRIFLEQFRFACETYFL